MIHNPTNNQYIESFWKNDTVNVEGFVTDEKGNRKNAIRLR